jgi:hypothetical protein
MIARTRGRRVVFAEVEAQHAQTSPIGTRRFSVPLLEHGEPITITVDLSSWSREPLARAFAIALREDLMSPRTVCTRSLIGTRVRELRRFWRFLDVTRVPLRDVASITAPLLDEYEQWLEQHQRGGSIHRRHLLARPLSLLRIMEERRAGTLNPTTVERLAYVSLAPYGRSVPRDAYSGAVSNTLRRTARTQVLSAASRIAPEGTLPAVPEGLHACVQDRYTKVLREIDRVGRCRRNIRCMTVCSNGQRIGTHRRLLRSAGNQCTRSSISPRSMWWVSSCSWPSRRDWRPRASPV